MNKKQSPSVGALRNTRNSRHRQLSFPLPVCRVPRMNEAHALYGYSVSGFQYGVRNILVAIVGRGSASGRFQPPPAVNVSYLRTD